MKKIYNAANNFEEQNILNELEENGIHPYIIDSGTGQYMNIAAGFSVYGKDIYVEEEDADKAIDIINRVKAEASEVEDAGREKVSWYRNKTILARILLGIVAVQAVIIFILCNFVI